MRWDRMCKAYLENREVDGGFDTPKVHLESFLCYVLENSACYVTEEYWFHSNDELVQWWKRHRLIHRQYELNAAKLGVREELQRLKESLELANTERDKLRIENMQLIEQLTAEQSK